jgi:uncharacterized Zn-binding protein involved in type VI secretion
MSLPKAPSATPPTKPTNALHDLSTGISTVIGAPQMAVDKFNEGFAGATQAIAAVFPALPAATIGSLTLGLPHFHSHPPSLIPPAPPIPLPPMGPITAGVCIQVLINGKPAARCGDIIMNPTCCGILPIGEIKMGSSNVFIGGARAARLTDITWHCPVTSGSPNRAKATAKKAKQAAEKASKLAKAMQAISIAGKVAGGLSIAGDAVEAVKADASGDAAMSAALAQSAAMAAAQMAADAASEALRNAMGKDPATPPGTLGAIITPGSVNVLIGGFPMVATMDLAKGFIKMAKALRRRKKKQPSPPSSQKPSCTTCPPN